MSDKIVELFLFFIYSRNPITCNVIRRKRDQKGNVDSDRVSTKRRHQINQQLKLDLTRKKASLQVIT